MKYWIFFVFGLFAVSCGDSEPEVRCADDALFERQEANGEMIFLMCYDAWGIKLDETASDDWHIIGASYDIPEEYKEEGLRVTLNGCFHTFDMPLLIPDPMPWGEMYVIKNFVITTK